MSLIRYNMNNIILRGGSGISRAAEEQVSFFNNIEICFFLTITLSESVVPINGHNLNFIKFKLSHAVGNLEEYDCCVEPISEKFNEIYFRFKRLDVHEVIESAKKALTQAGAGFLKVKEIVQEPLIERLVTFINSKNQEPINVYGSEFILETGMFLDRRIDRHSVFQTFIRNEKIKVLNHIDELNIIQNTIEIMPDQSENHQPESFYMEFKDSIGRVVGGDTSRKYKVHLSIKPEYTNQAIIEIMKYSQECLRTQWPFSVFRMMKIQNPAPVHLYESPMWNGWEQVVKDHPGGAGYIVMYPCNNLDYDTGERFKTYMTHFKNFWKTNFEDRYPYAKRDANYLPFNERVSDTIYVAHGSDTAHRMTALKKEDGMTYQQRAELRAYRSLFKASPKIYSYIDEFCKEGRSIASKQNISECLSNKFNINNIDCEGLRKAPLDHVDVWLLNNSNDLYDLSECVIPPHIDMSPTHT